MSRFLGQITSFSSSQLEFNLTHIKFNWKKPHVEGTLSMWYNLPEFLSVHTCPSACTQRRGRSSGWGSPWPRRTRAPASVVASSFQRSRWNIRNGSLICTNKYIVQIGRVWCLPFEQFETSLTTVEHVCQFYPFYRDGSILKIIICVYLSQWFLDSWLEYLKSESLIAW